MNSILRQLVLMRLTAFWDSLTRGGNSKKLGKKKGGALRGIGFGLLLVYGVGAFGFLVGNMFYMMGSQLLPAGLGWIYFAYVAVAVLLFNFLGSVFAVNSQLYDAKDNDLLLSMPIPPRYILLSRMISLMLINYIYAAVFALPAGVVYCMLTRVTAVKVLLFVAGTLVLPLLALSVSCLVGWLLGLVTMRMRRKNLVSLVFMLGFFALYMIAMMNINTYIQHFIVNAEDIGHAISRAFPPVYAYGAALADGNLLQFLLLLVYCIVPFLIVYLLLSGSFLRVATTKLGEKKAVYVEKGMRTSSARSALLRKEWGRFVSLPMYIMNAALGVLFELIFAVYVVINADKARLLVAQFLPMLEEMSPMGGSAMTVFALCVVLGLLSMMNLTTASSLSLEGKSLPQLQALPVRAIDIYNAKINLNLLVGLPSAIITGLACWITFKLSPLQGLFVILLPAAAQCFAAVFGMFANILLPRFDWRNETVAIKQGMSVLLSMFGGIALFILPMGLGFALMNLLPIEAVLALMTLFLLLLSAVFYQYIRTKGQKKFLSMA